MSCFLSEQRRCPAEDPTAYDEGEVPNSCPMYSEHQKLCYVVKWFMLNTEKTIVTKFPASPPPPEVR